MLNLEAAFGRNREVVKYQECVEDAFLQDLRRRLTTPLKIGRLVAEPRQLAFGIVAS